MCGATIMKKYSEPIQKIIELSKQMMTIADEGDETREDDGCGVLYGILRDSAYRIRSLAEGEKERHKNKGKWD